MKALYISLLLTVAISANAQNIIEWDGKYQLQLNDFQVSTTQLSGTSLISLMAGCSIDFSFYMSNVEFMFTKNFNSKVNCTFNKKASALVAPDSLLANRLLALARYDFDLTELYTRKFRKKIYEEKGAFSNVSFLKPLYDAIQQEYVERNTLAVKETDLGRNSELLATLHQKVLTEIEQLSDFCKTCKLKKYKK